MARLKREFKADYSYHITPSCNNRDFNLIRRYYFRQPSQSRWDGFYLISGYTVVSNNSLIPYL